MRGIDQEFIDDLKHGLLAPIFSRVQCDDTLMIGIRKNYINIYYRGGSLIKLSKREKKEYEAFFDKKYILSDSDPIPCLKSIITEKDHASQWAKGIYCLKRAMDEYLSKKSRKHEREFQQLVAWENNRSSIANSTEYFITDIELPDLSLGSRVDMLGVKWPSDNRKTGNMCRPVFIEMKYGDSSLRGEAGLLKHINDLRSLIEKDDVFLSCKKMILNQFKQLRSLNQLEFNESPTLDMKLDQKPEVVVVLANCNPRSSVLHSVLAEISDPVEFDLRFFVANFAGYAMHGNCMLGLEEFRNRLPPLKSPGRKSSTQPLV